MLLENAEGMIWPVVYLEEHGFFTGWAEFSLANNLALGDTLFFSFVRKDKFLVHVLGKTGCEKRVISRAKLMRRQQTRANMATQTQPVNPASPTPRRSIAPGFTRAECYGFRTPAPHSHGRTPRTDRPTPDSLARQFMSTKGKSSRFDFRKFQGQTSVPAPRHDNAPTPSWHGEAGPSTCPNLKRKLVSLPNYSSG